jgi:hypothetical protein
VSFVEGLPTVARPRRLPRLQFSRIWLRVTASHRASKARGPGDGLPRLRSESCREKVEVSVENMEQSLLKRGLFQVISFAPLPRPLCKVARQPLEWRPHSRVSKESRES